MTSSRNIPRLVTHHQSISSTWFHVIIYQETIAYLTVYDTYIFKTFRFSGKSIDVIMKVSTACNSSPVHFDSYILSKYKSGNNCLSNGICNTYIFKKQFRSSGKNLDVIKKDSKACNTSPAHFQLMVPK